MANEHHLMDKINNIEDELDQFLDHVNQKRTDRLKRIRRFDRQLLIGWILSIITSLIFSTFIILLFVFNTFKVFSR